MAAIYVDTAALVALGNKDDAHHSDAVRIYRRLVTQRYTFVTTSAVILETANTFSKAKYKPLFQTIFEMVSSSSYWDYRTISEEDMASGLSLFYARQDKDWSLTDCIGINVAKSLDTLEVFTTDQHFEQAGLNPLL